MQESESEHRFTKLQAISISLIQTDLRFIFTAVKNSERFKSNYWVSLMPYIGVVVDGAEDWLKAYNRCSKRKLVVPTFTKQEQEFYEEMRSSIKMWSVGYDKMYQELKTLYEESNQYFSSLCRPIARIFHLYDIFGVDLVNRQYCGNTILGAFYAPRYKFRNDAAQYGEHIKNIMEIGGKYVVVFDAEKEYETDPSMLFTYKDYGGFVKSPVGNKFSDRFMLFSLLCQIQFALICIDQFIMEECATKLRFLYLQYYYAVDMIEQYNRKTGANIFIDCRWVSDKFRNSMAHYKVGVALRTNEIILTDPLFGLTQKFLGCDYFELKQTIKTILESVAEQIKGKLHLK